MSSLFDLPFEDAPEPAPEPSPIYTVSELTAAIRGTLEQRFAAVAVEGELSNCRLWNTGHLYFTLKDGGAQIRGVMFRSAVRLLRFRPEDGLRVVARGRVGVYDVKGEYQLVCDALEPHGLGALQLRFEQLKKRLAAEGLFDQARKRPLPVLPRKIGIVTSLDGAALRDIVTVLRSRHAATHLVIRPTRVQGEGAAREIARGLAAVTRVPGVDVVIVGRGGGSLEDLWAFNEAPVARAIAASPVPVIAAVGHETDVTMADFAADLRAPTPSAAAEMVIARADEFSARIDRQAERLGAALRRRLQGARGRLHAVTARPAFAGFPAAVAMRGRHAAELTHDLQHATRGRLARAGRRLQGLRLALERQDLRRRLAATRLRLATADTRLAAGVRRRRGEVAARFGAAAARLESLSPLAVLGRGYAVCWDDGRTRIIRDAGSVAPGERVRVTLAAGELRCEVTRPDPTDS